MNPMKITDKVTLKEGQLFLIAGPCVLEEEETALEVGRELKRVSESLGIPYIFKASYDKANRSSASSPRGPGLEKGLEQLARIGKELEVPVLSDVHTVEEVFKAADVLDVIQVPAFLSRQTDLLSAAAKTDLPVNVKKGQFLAPWDMKNVFEKIENAGGDRIIVTERGASFGYNNLVADMRAIPVLREYGHPVVFDATHSIQLPGGMGDRSDGQREFVPQIASAAVAAGADGVFLEIHPNPDVALCDGPNMLKLEDAERVLKRLVTLKEVPW